MPRPPGIKETAPRDTAKRRLALLAARRKLTPLEVMLRTMDRAWDEMKRLEADETADSARIIALREEANVAARWAAPYMHPKLSAIAFREDKPASRIDLSALSVEQRRQLLTILRMGVIKAAGSEPESDDEPPLIEGFAGE